MNIELIIIGNEVLFGKTLNTNLAFIGQELARHGYYLTRESVLPDDHQILLQGFKEALERSDLVICAGGLGPTLDDKTREVAIELFNSGVHLDRMILSHLEERYGKHLSSIENQATIPDKATAIINKLGTAPGLIFEGEKPLILLPGVPYELSAMFKEGVIPFILKRFPILKKISGREIHLYELSENSVDPLLRTLEKKYPSVAFGIYPSLGTLSVSLTTFEDPNILERPIQEIEREFATNCFNASTSEEAVLNLFCEKKWSLSAAESCTGGALSSRITQISGSSKYFLGSIIAYSNEIKTSILRVPEKLIAEKGAVSKEVAEAMAAGILKLTGSDFSLAVTGVAGPTGGTPDKPVGTVWCSIGHTLAPPHSWLLHARGNRSMVIARSVTSLLNNLLTYTKKYNV